jgi:hypothetical protein
MPLLFCQLASAKVLFTRSCRRCFLSYIAFVNGTIKNFGVAVVSLLVVRVYLCHDHVHKVETMRKLGIQAVCLDPSFDDETNDFSVFS